jgi:hypothetical protein
MMHYLIASLATVKMNALSLRTVQQKLNGKYKRLSVAPLKVTAL